MLSILQSTPVIHKNKTHEYIILLDGSVSMRRLTSGFANKRLTAHYNNTIKFFLNNLAGIAKLDTYKQRHNYMYAPYNFIYKERIIAHGKIIQLTINKKPI